MGASAPETPLPSDLDDESAGALVGASAPETPLPSDLDRSLMKLFLAISASASSTPCLKLRTDAGFFFCASSASLRHFSFPSAHGIVSLQYPTWFVPK